ncbi:MAG: M20/M25/M40 family metallo-hydrolase [Sandaracinus sp.]
MAEVRAAQQRAETGAQTFDHVQGLTDAAGPRLAGSTGDPLAVAWGVARMQALGFANVHAEPVTVHVWARGEERIEMTSPVPHRLAGAALGGSVGTPEGGIEALVVRVASLDELRALPREQAEGHIVFVDARMERARDGHGYGQGVRVRIQSASIAAERGALAVVIRSVGTDDTRFAHTGVMHYEDGVARIPAAAISNADADVLARTLAAGQDVRLRLSLGCHELPDAQSANVIGEVPGTDRASEVVLLGAHLDSWDLGRGAVDDGAGVAIVMEAARQILVSPTRPRRTVRVVLFANEENGGAGAHAYAEAHASELGAHVAALEADFGDGAAWGLRTPDAPERTEAWQRVASLLAPMGVEWTAEEPHGGADIGPMHEAGGVPAVDVEQDGTRYFDLHHTANDVLTEIDRSSLDHAMRAVLTVAYAAALDVDGIHR